MAKAIILCGISGSGKTSLAKEHLRRTGEPAVICSADSYFTDASGYYDFDASKLSEAHAYCLRAWIESLREFRDVVCDNTNTTEAEILPYAAAAKAYGYNVTVIVLDCDPVVAWRRNRHGVPLAVVEAQYARLRALRRPRFHVDVWLRAPTTEAP